MENKNVQIIKLKKAHADIERYLQMDCYCPGEIYDVSGFFFRIYKPDNKCFILGEAIGGHNLYWSPGYQGLYVICENQILEFAIEKDKIVDAMRMDATVNNIEIFTTIIKTGKAPSGAKLDKFEKNHADGDLKQLFNLCDAIMVD